MRFSHFLFPISYGVEIASLNLWAHSFSVSVCNGGGAIGIGLNLARVAGSVDHAHHFFDQGLGGSIAAYIQMDLQIQLLAVAGQLIG